MGHRELTALHRKVGAVCNRQRKSKEVNLVLLLLEGVCPRSPDHDNL